MFINNKQEFDIYRIPVCILILVYESLNYIKPFLCFSVNLSSISLVIESIS